MAVITVPASGLQFSDTNFNDVLQPGSDVDPNGTAYVEVDGHSTLQSLYIGSSIEVDIGFFASGSLTGTGTITGATDPNATLPALVNYGILDINGAIDVALSNNSQLVIGSGERLDLEGDLLGLGASTVSIATGGEFDLNSQNTAIVSAITSQGTLKVTAPNTSVSGATTFAGAVIVQGDAQNALGSGVASARSTGNANGAYVAALDLRNATFSAPITSLTLLQDAKVSFGTGPTTVQRLAITGSATALVPLDVLSADGTLTVTGDGSGAANQVALAAVEFTGGNTIDFAVAATSGGASLQGQLLVDAGTTLRNDGTMTIGGQGTATTTLGAASAAAGSSFVNGSAGQLTVETGAALGVAAIQNAGAITVAGNATILQSFANTGSVDVASGTLALETAMQGAGTITVENGATLSLDAAFSGGTIALRSGGVLRLSQPSSFAGMLQAPAIGAKIDLVGVTAIAASETSGSIAVTTTTGSLNLSATALINNTTLALSSDGAGGTLLTVAAQAAAQPTPAANPVVYRFFDNVHGTHFFTASLTETQTIQATRTDLVYEGVGLDAVNAGTDPNAAPVFRFFDTKFGTHFYTASTTERDDVLASRPDLVSEGIGFYEHTTAQTGDVPVYRFFDSHFGTHFYTDSATERATIVATRPDLVSEGIGFYAPAS